MESSKALRIAMRRAGVTATGLAEEIGTTQQRVSQWRHGTYNLSRKAILKLAEQLDCDAAWLSGTAPVFPFYDSELGQEIYTHVMRTEAVPDGGGVLYHLYREETGEIIPVLLRMGAQFAPFCWQLPANHPRTATDIAKVKWVDAEGRPTIMENGLPCRYPEK